MPWQRTTMTENRNQEDMDLYIHRERHTQYNDGLIWLSDNNSYYGTLGASSTLTGDVDHITTWDLCEVRISSTAVLTALTMVYTVSMDDGRTFPFTTTLNQYDHYQTFPLTGQYGRLTITTSSSWAPSTFLQVAVIYRRNNQGTSVASVTSANNVVSGYRTSNQYEVIQYGQPYLNVRVVNDWMDDYLRGLVAGRTTGFLAGYSDSISSSYQSVCPISSGFLPLIPVGGINNLQIASGSVQDAPSGTGISIYIYQVMLADYSTSVGIIVLDGTTPVSFGINGIYRFIIGFPFSAGSGYVYSGLIASNKGIIYVGTGAFSDVTGFATTYCLNRIDDGVIPSPIYTVPKGKRSLLFELKYASDAANAVVFRTYGRPGPTEPWSLQIEDTVLATIQPRRSLVGGWNVPGAEFAVIAKKKGGSSVSCNVIGTIIEIDETLFTTAPGIF